MSAYPGGAHLVALPCSPSELPSALWSSGAIALTASQRSAVVDAALSCQGIPYSFLDYAAIALHRLGLKDPALKRYIASTGHMMCSFLVDWVYQYAGIHFFTDERWPGYVTPADLAAVVKNRGGGVEVTEE
jgi:cell wall-associated NlpC family hydrolase